MCIFGPGAPVQRWTSLLPGPPVSIDTRAASVLFISTVIRIFDIFAIVLSCYHVWLKKDCGNKRSLITQVYNSGAVRSFLSIHSVVKHSLGFHVP